MKLKLYEISKLENMLNELATCQETAGVIMTDAKYVQEAADNLNSRIKDIGDRLNKLIQENLEE